MNADKIQLKIEIECFFIQRTSIIFTRKIALYPAVSPKFLIYAGLFENKQLSADVVPDEDEARHYNFAYPPRPRLA